jgi:ribosome biogenesis GTPase / thiamine phosphate phosphatase
VSSREGLGWNPFFEAHAAALGDRGWQFARVIEEQRGLYRIDGDAQGWAEVSGRFRHDAADAAAFPAVGDWVGVRGSGFDVRGSRSGSLGSGSGSTGSGSGSGSRAVIECVLQRRTMISRAAAGRVTAEQVVAANVDTIFVVTALPHDLNTRRLERYLAMVWDGGAVPVVLINKADLSDDPEAASRSVAARLPFVDVVVVSALHARGLDALAPYLQPAKTVALVGSSGVGKSTLVNRLLGRDVLRVAATSEADGKGRHTTTARQLLELPDGALLIDTPGMRELQPWLDGEGLDAAFDDLADIARGCRFADCAHDGEPGCAVAAAVADGRLDADRLDNYRRLAREAAFEDRKRDKAAAAEHKRKWKQLHQAAKALYRDRDRDRG